MKKIIVLLAVIVLVSCNSKAKKENGKLKVVTTTTMITDLVKNIGGEKLEVHGLMGAGVDPHLYKASEGDVSKLFSADIVVYNGVHLEGKLGDVFKKMEQQQKKIIVVAEGLAKTNLISSELFVGNHDPHIWHDSSNWETITKYIVAKLVKMDSVNAKVYQENGNKYLEKLTQLNKDVNTKINELPVDKRILVTAHDAFSYFGRQHKFNVVGLQGISTATEAGIKDVQKLAAFIIEKKIKAVFIESSVPKRTIEALQQSVKSKGHDVVIGGTLYSDALGSKGTEEGTYIGMYKANVNTIVNALK